eukprot:SAG31_NODE_11239_length_1050_cov_3.634069_1_plen_349_part_11
MTNTELGTVGFDVTGVCADNYAGTVEVTACTEDGDYSVTGCELIVCTDPGTAGYTMTNTELNTVTGFDVTGVCADDYTGTVEVTACTEDGDYSVTGCVLDVTCTDPGTAGYTMTNTELGTVGFDVTGVCADNYAGTVEVTACTEDGAYSVTGCVLDFTCTDPETAGYTMFNTELVTSADGGFDVTGKCDCNYEGTVTVTECTEDGPYTVAGCAAIVCTDPGTAGYTMTNTELSTVTGFDVTGVCADNYAGTVEVTACTEIGDYSVTGCEPIVCTDPETAGYTMTNTELDTSADGGFVVTGVCADDYTGTVEVTACTESGDYSVTGCELIVCTDPETAGYTMTNTELNTV